jgi:hypothetical protein
VYTHACKCKNDFEKGERMKERRTEKERQRKRGREQEREMIWF